MSVIEREDLQTLANRLAAARQTVQPGHFYRHYRGAVYEVIEIAALEEDGELMVVYRPVDYDNDPPVLGRAARKTVMHVSPLDEFTGTTYSEVPGGVEKVSRFVRVVRHEVWR